MSSEWITIQSQDSNNEREEPVPVLMEPTHMQLDSANQFRQQTVDKELFDLLCISLEEANAERVKLIENISDQFCYLKNSTSSMKQELVSKIACLEQTIGSLARSVAVLHENQEKIYSELNQRNLILSGVREPEGETAETLTTHLNSYFGQMLLSLGDASPLLNSTVVEFAKREEPEAPPKGHRQIKVTFTTRSYREKIFDLRHILGAVCIITEDSLVQKKDQVGPQRRIRTIRDVTGEKVQVQVLQVDGNEQKEALNLSSASSTHDSVQGIPCYQID